MPVQFRHAHGEINRIDVTPGVTLGSGSKGFIRRQVSFELQPFHALFIYRLFIKTRIC